MIERKIGEIFEVNGRKIQCVLDIGICRAATGLCAFLFCGEDKHERMRNILGECAASYRTDGKSVCFIQVKP